MRNGQILPIGLLCFLGAISFVAICYSVAAAELQPLVSPRSTIRFENRQVRSKARFILNNCNTPDKPIIDSVLGGVALFDFDRDGYLDIYFTNGAHIPELAKSDPAFYNRLFRNNHDGTFTDVTAVAGVRGEGYSMGAAAADYDNDGWTDLYVAGVNRNILYHNNGNGTFTDVTSRAGVDAIDAGGSKPWSTGAVWFDYDNDGLLDLFVVNYLDWSFEKNRLCGSPAHHLSCSPEMYLGRANILYHNNGNGTFTDVSQATGIGAHKGKGMSAAIADFDGDGFMDLLVTNDKEPNFLLHNIGGKTFSEQAVQAGVGFNQDGVAVSSMGVDFRDLNNDGEPDAVVTALAGETFLCFLNEKGLFSERSYQAGLGFASLKMSGWGLGIYDFDNDGYKDVFTANSHVSENVAFYGSHKYSQANAVFQNLHNGAFRDVSSQAGNALQAEAAHRGSAFGDLNHDGKIDVVVAAIGSPAEILVNTTENSNHWIELSLIGTKSNRDGIGTQVVLKSPSGMRQYNHVTTAVGYASSSDNHIHFGLGDDTTISEIELHWPSGIIQKLRNVPGDQVLIVTEQ